MSNIVDNRVVQMLFDNKQFESGVEESSKSLNNLNKLLNGFGSTSASLAGSAVEELAEKFNRLGILGVTAIQNIANKITDSLTTAIKGVSIDQLTAGFSKYEDKITSVQTIMSATEQSWKADALNIARTNDLIAAGFDEKLTPALENLYAKVGDKGKVTKKELKDLGITMEQWNTALGTMQGAQIAGTQMDYVSEKLEKLNWFTDETSFSFTDMTSNIGKFTSQGVDLSTATRAMEGIATWAAKSGQNAESASRAMYNMSQALGVGAVKLQDWKSIENANMATVQFKEEAMKAAVAVGTLTKAGDKYYVTGTQDEVTTANFSQTLSKAWFSADVLMKTLDKYGGFADEIGKVTAEFQDQGVTTSKLLTGIDAYQEALKGNSEAYDTWIKDIEKMGVTAEEIIPYIQKLSSDEYELGRASFKAAQEAKTFSDAMDATKDAVSTAWMNLFETVFGNYEEAKVIWTDLANSLYTIFAEPVNMLTEFIERIGAAEGIQNLIGWVTKLADTIQNNVINNSDTIINTAVEIFDALKWVWNTLKDFVGSIITPIKEAFREIFPKKSADEIMQSVYRVTFYIEKFFATLKLGDKESSSLKRTFEGIFAIFDILKSVVDAVIRVISNLSPTLKEAGGGFLEGTAKVGDFLVKLRDSIKENDTFYKILKKLSDFVVPVFRTVFSIVGKVAGAFGTLFNKAKDSGIIDRLASAFSNLKDKMIPLSEVFDRIKSAAQVVWDFIKGIYNSIKEMISGIDFSKIKFGDILTTGIGAGAGIGIIAAFKSIKEFFDNGGVGSGLLDKLKDIGKSLEGILSSIKGAIQGFTNDLNAGALLKVAAALLVLAIALAAFAAISQMEGIEDGLLIMTAAFGALFAALKVMDTIKSKVAATAAALLILAGAMLVLAVALAAFALIAKMKTAWDGFALMATTLLVVTAALLVLGEASAKVIIAAAAMVLLASAMLILAGAVAAFAAVAMMDTFGTGLAAFMLVLLMVVAALLVLGETGPMVIVAAAAMVLLSAAMLILAGALAAFAAVAMMDTFGEGIAAFTLVLLLMVAALVALGATGPMVLVGAAALLVMSAAMVVLAGALAAFAAVAMMDTFGTGLAVMAAMLLVLVAALIVLGAAGPIVLVGAAALLVGAAALVALALAVAACALVLPLLANGLEALFTALTNIAQQIVDLIFNIMDQASVLLVKLADAIGQAVDKLFEGISSGIEKLGGGIGLAIEAVGNGIASAIESVLESIGTGIGKGLEGIATGIEKIGDSVSNIGSGIGDVGLGVQQFGDGIRSLKGIPWVEIATGMSEIVTPLKNLSKVNLSGLNNNLQSVIQTINNANIALQALAVAAQNSIQDFINAFTAGTPQASAAAETLGKTAGIAAYQYSYWHNAGSNNVTAFVSGLNSGISSASSAGSSLAYSAANSMSGLYYSFYSAGANAAQGFVNGLSSYNYSAYNAGVNLGVSASNGIRNRLQIQSPSKVFYRYGRYVDEGFADGIADYADLASRSAGEMALDSVGKVSDILANAINNDYSNPVIRPSLDLSEVSSGASQISSMLNGNSIGLNGQISNGQYGQDGVMSNTVNNYFTINAQPNQNVDDIANAVERKLNMVYYQRKAAGLA